MAHAVPGLLIAMIAWPVWIELHLDSWVRWVLICTSVVTGSALALRGYLVGVTCLGDRATVHGYFRTRTIRRRQITELTDFPAIVWQDEAGQKRWSPIVAFMEDTQSLRRHQQHTKDCIKRLKRWIKNK
jgi:hypothetical protein